MASSGNVLIVSRDARSVGSSSDVTINTGVLKKSSVGNFNIRTGAGGDGKSGSINITASGGDGINEAGAEVQKPQHRLTAMFPATMSIEVEQIAKKYLRHPAFVYIGDQKRTSSHGLHKLSKIL
jgi:hypothetical protein